MSILGITIDRLHTQSRSLHRTLEQRLREKEPVGQAVWQAVTRIRYSEQHLGERSHPSRNQRLIALLDQFAKSDPETEAQDLAQLRQTLAEGRPGQRDPFGEAVTE